MSEELRQRLIDHLRADHRVQVTPDWPWERVERLHGADHDLDGGWDHQEAHDLVWGPEPAR